MTSLTAKQAAILLVRFFGFYLLFYGAISLTEFPSYWLRCSFSQDHPMTRVTHNTAYNSSFDASLLISIASGFPSTSPSARSSFAGRTGWPASS